MGQARLGADTQQIAALRGSFLCLGIVLLIKVEHNEGAERGRPHRQEH